MDLAFEMMDLDPQKANLFYYYMETIVRCDPFTAHASHTRKLPADVPKIALPPSLAPDGSDACFLRRYPSGP